MAMGTAVAMIAPSFPGAFPEFRPWQVLSALRKLGFAGVFDVSFGADLVSRVYAKRYLEAPKVFNLTTACPVTVFYVQKYAPELVPFLSPLLSPMAAMGKAIKERIRPGARTVFIGPCLAKAREAQDPEVSPWVDASITFSELRRLFVRSSLDVGSLIDEDFDPPHARLGGIYPLAGGLLRVADMPSDPLYNYVSAVSGSDSFIELVERLRQRLSEGELHQVSTRFFETLFCHGCVAGPGMSGSESALRRKERVVDFVRSRTQNLSVPNWEQSMRTFEDIDLSRKFSVDDQRLPEPTEEQIRRILAQTNKLSANDELNCGVCGYVSCRQKAVAVYNGLAEVEMCLPYLVEQLEATVEELNLSHQQLTETQAQLIRSERLASMGQLAAGIAHELNNPLGTILLFSHLLKEAARTGTASEQDAETIMREATRCKNIVAGLLDFARQNKVSRTKVVLRELMNEAIRCVRGASPQIDTTFQIDCPTGLPMVSLDRDQMLQVFINVIRNAVEAMHGHGAVTLGARFRDATQDFLLTVRDTGPGIPEQHMAKLFSPFFTTKPVGQGTGLGLSICFGIIKMHRGTITARNNTDGPGASFEITLPGPREGMIHGREQDPDRG
jgi:signal transduction histidine kinase